MARDPAEEGGVVHRRLGGRVGRCTLMGTTLVDMHGLGEATPVEKVALSESELEVA